MEIKYDRRLFLKIKLKNLRDEVALIRAEEDRLRPIAALNTGKAYHAHLGTLVRQMEDHRKADIRAETRATLLAYGYIRGRRYDQIEQNPGYEPPELIKRRVERVAKMVNKYSVMYGYLFRPDSGTMDKMIREWMGVDETGRRVHLQPVPAVPSVSSETPVAAQA